MSRTTLFVALLGLPLLGMSARAERLPGLDQKKWIGFYVAHETRKFEWGIMQNGESILYLLDRRERSKFSNKPELRCILEEKVEGRWVRRQYDDEEFAYEGGASTEADGRTITYSFTGDTRVAVAYRFSDGEVVITPSLVGKKTENELRFGLELIMPYVWKPSGDEELSERDLKRRIEDAEIRAVRTEDGKRVRYRLWESVKLGDEETLAAGAKEVSIEIAKFGPSRIVLRPGADETPLKVLHTGPLYAGFKVAWFPDLEKLGNEGCRLVIAVE